MIPANVHMHPATRRVWLGENFMSVPELTDEELRDIDGQIAFLSHDELKVSIHDKVEDAARGVLSPVRWPARPHIPDQTHHRNGRR